VEVDVLPAAVVLVPETGFLAASRDRSTSVIQRLRETYIGNESDGLGEHAHNRRDKRCGHGFLGLIETGEWHDGQLKIKLMKCEPLNKLPTCFWFKTRDVCGHQFAVCLPVAGYHGIEEAMREGE